MFDSVFQQDIYIPVLIDTRNHTDSSVHPPTFIIIINKNHLCLFLDCQIQLCWQRWFGKIPIYTPCGNKLFTRQFRQLLFIDEVYLIAPGSKCNVHIFVIRLKFRKITGIQNFQLLSSCRIAPYPVGIGLAINFLQLNRHQVDWLENPGWKEERTGIEKTEYLFLVRRHNRLQLKHVSDKQ